MSFSTSIFCSKVPSKCRKVCGGVSPRTPPPVITKMWRHFWLTYKNSYIRPWDLSPSQSLLLWFGLFRTSRCSAICRLVSVSIFAALVCSTPGVDLLVVDLSRLSRQSVSTFRALCWNLDSLCLLFSCLWRLSKYSHCRWTSSCKLMFNSPKLLSIRSFSHRFEFGFCLAAFCTFVIAYVERLPSTQTSHAVAKRTVYRTYK